MNIKQAKLKRLAGIMRTVFDILFWASVVSGIMGFLAFVASYFIPDSFFVITNSQKGKMGITIDGMVNFKINPEGYNNLSIKPLLQNLFPMATVISILLMVLLHQVRLILKTVAMDVPFDKNNPKRLLNIGITLLIGAFAVEYVEGRVAQAIVDLLKLEDIVINISPDGIMIFTGFLVIILAGVFQYGNYLQEEYDATL